jgi:hypothetical protein
MLEDPNIKLTLDTSRIRNPPEKQCGILRAVRVVAPAATPTNK